MKKVDNTIRRHREYNTQNVSENMASFSDASAIEVGVRHLSQKYGLPVKEAFVLVTSHIPHNPIMWAGALAADVADLTYNHRGLRHITVSKTVRYAVLADNSSLTIQVDEASGKWLLVQAQMPPAMVPMTFTSGHKLQAVLDDIAITNTLAIRSQAEAFLLAAERTRLSPVAAAMFFFKIDHFPSADFIIGDREGGGRALSEVRMPDGTGIRYDVDGETEIFGVSDSYLRLDGQLVPHQTIEQRLDRVMRDPNVQMMYGSVLRIMAEQRKQVSQRNADNSNHGELVQRVEAVAV